MRETLETDTTAAGALYSNGGALSQTAAGPGRPTTTSPSGGLFMRTARLEWTRLASVLAPEVAIIHKNDGPAVSSSGPVG